MQYNFHNEKYKQSDIGGIHKEQFREYKDPGQYKNAVHSEMSDKNSYLELAPRGSDWYRYVRQAKEKTVASTGKSVRKDAVVLCSTVESVPVNWSADACNKYFLEKAKWYEEYLRQNAGVDADSMLSVCIHLDETTPHATYVWLPMKEGRLQAKNILNRTFLKSLQTDSQNYTMNWITQWNSKNIGQQLECLEPIKEGSKKKHLTEQEYKAEKISEKVQAARNELEQITNQIGDLAEEKQNLEKMKELTEAARIEYTEHSSKADEIRKEYEKKLMQLTDAPDVETYETIRKEVIELRTAIQTKDSLIEQLTAALEHWKEQADIRKRKFMNLAEKAGTWLMELLGFDDMKGQIPEFPDARTSSGIVRLLKEGNKYDPKLLKVVADSRDEDLFMVVFLDGKDEVPIRRGFENREEADRWKKNYTNMAHKMRKDRPSIGQDH